MTITVASMSETLRRITIRPTVEEDVESLWRMLFYASHSDDEPGVTPHDVRSNPDLVGYIEGWRRGGRVGMIANSGDLAVGAAWLRELGEQDRSNPVFMGTGAPELAIAVLPEYQGQGVGSALISALLEAVGDRSAIVLSARLDNPAIRLYQRFGFEMAGEMTNRVGTVSVKMQRPGMRGV